MGGGCEMVHFGHVSGKSSHVEGGLSTVHFAICVNQTPNITKEVFECGWLQLSSAEKIFDSAAVDRRRWQPTVLLLLACMRLAYICDSRNGAFPYFP